MKQSSNTWEDELWQFISLNDDSFCPRHHTDACKEARLCGVYFKENIQNNDTVLGALESGELSILNGKLDPLHSPSCYMFRLVEVLANKYIEKARLTVPPIPIEIVDYFDISLPVHIARLSMKSRRGAVWHTGEDWLIQLNGNDSPYLQRLTLFHEAFHIIARSKTNLVLENLGTGKRLINELLADQFSNCIQMPADWIIERWHAIRDLDKMVDLFQVTPLAMRLRLERCLNHH